MTKGRRQAHSEPCRTGGPAWHLDLAGALGSLDHVGITANTGVVEGWIMHPDLPIDDVRVVVNGNVLGTCQVRNRPDVGEVFPPVAHAARCGFRVEGPLHGLQGKTLRVETIGLLAGVETICTEDHRPGDDVPAAASPGEDLMERVSASRNAEAFRRTGYCIAAQMLAALREHLPAPSPRMLDWGCGSGRATRYVPLLWPRARLAGCDIDARAIAWCRDNIAGQFDATGPFPPLPYADQAFDAVIASSVMTHLAWPVQHRWLQEIRRVLAPGGIFVTSVLGTLASFALPEPERAALARDGIMDSRLDPALNDVAPENYYRSTYQEEAFTRRHWGENLDVLAFRRGGLTNFQDLVVMQRRPTLWERLARR